MLGAWGVFTPPSTIAVWFLGLGHITGFFLAAMVPCRSSHTTGETRRNLYIFFFQCSLPTQMGDQKAPAVQTQIIETSSLFDFTTLKCVLMKSEGTYFPTQSPPALKSFPSQWEGRQGVSKHQIPPLPPSLTHRDPYNQKLRPATCTCR